MKDNKPHTQEVLKSLINQDINQVKAFDQNYLPFKGENQNFTSGILISMLLITF